MFCRNCGNQVGENAEVCTKCGVRPLNGDKFCQGCGVEVNPRQEICIKCGVRLLGGLSGAGGTGKMITPSGSTKSPTTATILSCLIVGVGQMYLGQSLKGVVMLAAAIVLGFFTFGLLSLPIWIAGMIDANKIGKKLQAGRSVGEWEFF